MKKIFIAVISISLLLTNCKGEGSKSETKINDGVTSQESNKSGESNTANASADSSGDAICLLDKLSVREEPKAKAKWVTSMSLGEKVYYTGETHTDSVSKKEYSKVKLIDGKEGWARSPFLAINGKVGAMTKTANVYKRPDLLTKTDTKYSPMDIIAVIGTQDDWAHVKGKRAEGKYIEEVWVKSNNISNKSVDIATAKFASLAMGKGDMTERIKALEEIVSNSDFSDSSFMDIIKDKIRDYQSKNVPVDVKDAKVDEEF